MARMDLKSMLNESTVARPRPASPQASHQPTRQQTYPPYNGNLATSLAHQTSQRERPSQPPPLRPPEAFAQNANASAGCNSAQSPSQYTSASIPSIHSDGTRSVFGGSSSGQSQSATTRDVSLYNSHYPPSFVPSPASHSSNHLNQGPVQQHQYLHLQRPPSGFPAGASLHNVNVPQESPVALNGPQHSSSRQFSPHASHPSLPGTPLGPPATFQKASPQATQRAASYGLEHTRTHSAGSLGSQHGYEHSERTMSHQQSTPSRESSVRQYSYDREREKSMSVSPKTIPQPSPLRKASTEYSQSRMTSPPPRPSVPSSSDPSRLTPSVEARLDGASPLSSITPRDQDHGSSPHSSNHQSPRPPAQYSTPSSNNAMPPTISSPAGQRQPVLKRTASAISGSSSSAQPPRKRSKRTEVPIFARSARPNKPPIRLIRKVGVQPVSHTPAPISGNAPVNGNTNHTQPMQSMPVIPPAPIGPSDWEPSITGSIPHEELTRYICDMIFNTIGNADPPTGGAVFEIEAKLGEIHNIEEGRRLRLPVMTETIFDKHNFGPPTKFESSMNIEQHRALNSYLNNLCAESQHPPRTPMFYDHPRETDTFYSLTAAGESSLPPSVRAYLNPKHRPRVRITTSHGPRGDSAPPVVRARIIKSRIADLDVYCPTLAFDYRISISIECPFDGPDDVLVKVNDTGAAGSGGGGSDREKDRVSYRHLAYQIDLTQVSYPNSTKREHELEIEISTEMLRAELENLREQRPSRYEDLVRGFIDNVRILARKGTIGKR